MSAADIQDSASSTWLLRTLAFPEDLFLPRKWRRASKRLRLSGRAFLLALVLLQLAAWNTGINLFYLLVGGLSSFLLISILLTRWVLRGLRISREGPDAVHRGEKFAVTIRVENHKSVVPAVSLRLESARQPGQTAAYVLKIPPRRAAVVRMSEVFDRRGVQILPQIDIACAFPFGLFESRRRQRDTLEVVVYPRVIAVRAAVLEHLPGLRDAPRVARGDGDEFFSLRDYIRGDDLRRVAWRVSARRGNLVVKEMARETTRFVVFVLDTVWQADLDNFDDLFEEAVELVASLAVTMLNQQYTVSIVTPSSALAAGEGKTHIHKVLELLARVTPIHDDALQNFAWFRPGEEAALAAYAFVSPDPRDWGQSGPRPASLILDPREVIRA